MSTKGDDPSDPAALGRVAKASVAQGQPYKLRHPPYDILLACIGDRYYAIEDACPHSGVSLCRGALHGHHITCPSHGWVIDVRTGDVVLGPGRGERTTTYRVVDEADAIVVYPSVAPPSLKASASFKDHFSQHSATYAQYRPRYPTALFEALANLAPRRDLAWDCATGNGQAALALAAHFEQVVATDPSAAQIAQGTLHERVDYRVEPAEQSTLEDGSVALITVAQALHWFDLAQFYAEVRRVSQSGAVLAAWGYGFGTWELPSQRETANLALRRFYAETLGPYWPPERVHFETGYTSLAFPFERLALPPFDLTHAWNLDALCGYVATWSAYQRCVKQTGRDPLPALRAELEAVCPDAGQAYVYRAPLFMLAGRVTG